ncbi:MAG: hypothetical protein SGJ04_10855 [Bacteroidota bacterium]|nr:hypothetical protein [Bacteroidota bacterium]
MLLFTTNLSFGQTIPVRSGPDKRCPDVPPTFQLVGNTLKVSCSMCWAWINNSGGMHSCDELALIHKLGTCATCWEAIPEGGGLYIITLPSLGLTFEHILGG